MRILTAACKQPVSGTSREASIPAQNTWWTLCLPLSSANSINHLIWWLKACSIYEIYEIYTLFCQFLCPLQPPCRLPCCSGGGSNDHHKGDFRELSRQGQERGGENSPSAIEFAVDWIQHVLFFARLSKWHYNQQGELNIFKFLWTQWRGGNAPLCLVRSLKSRVLMKSDWCRTTTFEVTFFF